MELDLKTIIRKRGSIKHSLTSFKNHITGVEEKDRLEESCIIELRERVTKLENLYQEFHEIQTSIEGLCEEEDVEKQYEEREKFNTSYFNVIARAKAFIKLNTPETETSSVSGAGSSPAGSVIGSNYSENHIKLPTIQLNKFSGSYETWIEFRDTYISIIHENKNINNISKLHYLRSSLEGQAAQVIRSLEISEANYHVAWKLLRDRYDNKRLLVNNHIKALFNLPAVKAESAVELRKLLDDLSKHVLALEVLGQPVQHWGALLIYLVTSKLDTQLNREWQLNRISESDEFPKFQHIQEFLKGRCELLETLEQQNTKRTYSVNKRYAQNSGSVATVSLVTSGDKARAKCLFCESDEHFIYSCKTFLNLNANDRTVEAKSRRLCINCLKKNHFSTECRSGPCRKCRKKHHSLLHYGSNSATNASEQNTANSPKIEEVQGSTTTVVANCSSLISQRVLLSTAIVQVKDREGHQQYCRALLDSGSESCFVTSELCERLRLNKTEINLAVVGINQKSSRIRYKTEIQLQSCQSSYSANLTCFVIDKITENIKVNSVKPFLFGMPQHIKLADFNDTYQSNKIDLLIGANIFWDLLCTERIKLGNNQPLLQKTVLGYILVGPFGLKLDDTKNLRCNLIMNVDVQDQLRGFWELEECRGEKKLSSEEVLCERQFSETTERDNTGRFIVSIPFKENKPKLGDSLNTAIKRFYSLERKLNKDSNLREQYVAFMQQYEKLGHMTRIENPNLGSQEVYYLPHHGVQREMSLSTKLRVVYDGSCKTSNNISLNDTQLVGPVIQEELFNILLRFRTYLYVLSADVEKMYRQVLIKPEQRNYQRIVWRENNSECLKHYTLNTVTYGTASAPYLAIRSLHQAAYDSADRYPRATEVILKGFYVDDLLTGTNSIKEAIQLQREITTILDSVGFPLRKWISNNTKILEGISETQNELDILHLGKNEEKRTLGLTWAPGLDYLRYDVGNLGEQVDTTKREILSSISRLFDPLGLVGPCVIIAKIILQELWIHNISWDDPVPDPINKKWNQFKDELVLLNQIRIPRHVPSLGYMWVELHAFCDASEVAYGSCIYIRAISSTNSISVNLLCAKSRVSPIKTVTIPRLELCGAVLSARLVSKVNSSLNVNFNRIFYWCDSTVVLHWLQIQPNHLKTFVAHRVAEIQERTDIKNWCHVSTTDNPADLISRGVWPSNLKNSSWWVGPKWLALPQDQWPPVITQEGGNNIPELKRTVTLLSVNTEKDSFPFQYTSSLIKLQRLVAWCLRFKGNCKAGHQQRIEGNLTVRELNQALNQLAKVSQAESFLEELELLRNQKNPKGKLLYLSPFLDDEGLIRVGGRLKHSDFSYDKRHPILLSGKHALAKLILEHEHMRLLHAGPQLMLASVRERFWPTAGRNLCKAIVHKCIRCYKVKPVEAQQIMGDLPKNRVIAMHPFYATGVDYAGPFFVKSQKGRGHKSFKCYICLFVCLATKAIHLEPVTELTTEAFIATLRRFVARRGRPSHIYSDNGSNFLGATSQLKELGKFLLKNNDILNKSGINENITWHFIPAKSPHFGGIWEAGVKATKHHLKRVLCNALVTFEDFLTIITQIESVLNSRPLHPMSSSPDDLEPLTPSHFLLGRNASSVPDPEIEDVPINRLSRFQHLQRMLKHFWRRWSLEYISELQQKHKWTKQQKNISIGELVLLKEDNLPPLKWRLGRVTNVHPGSDKVVRVVSVRTSSGVVKRAISKVCVLPITETSQTEGHL